MTIALGLVGTDGIVIAADTEESYGAMKNNTTKILTVSSVGPDGKAKPSDGACVITNAGDSGYASALAEKLAHVFMSHRTAMTPALQEAFEECLATFYAKHVIPFVNFPDDERPAVEMLVACCLNKVYRLFFNDKSVMAPVIRYRAVGMGGPFAEHLLERLYRPAPTKILEVLAAYVVFLTKKSIRSCGKFTQIISLRGEGELLHWCDSDLDSLEKTFSSQWLASERDSMWKLITQSVSKEGQP